MDIEKAQELYSKSFDEQGKTKSLNSFDYLIYHYYKIQIDFCVKRAIKKLDSSYKLRIYNPTNGTVRALKVIAKEYKEMGYQTEISTRTHVFSYELSEISFYVSGWTK